MTEEKGRKRGMHGEQQASEIRTQLRVSSLQIPFLWKIRLKLKLEFRENITALNRVGFVLLR